MTNRHSAVLLWFGVLMLTTIFLFLRANYAGLDQVLFADNDDAMRMVVVRDFLSGQNWFDHAQYRLNTPYGGDMHWSRLIDVPIAGLVLLARPVFGSGAENAVGYLWPVMLLGLFIWINGQLTLLLVGRDGLLPGMLISAFSVITFGEFNFGRIDHHSVQFILTQLAVLFTIDALTRPKAAIWAGLAVATSLAIGTETLPVIVATIATYGVLYIASSQYNPAIRWFGVAFGFGCVGHLILALPPGQWFSPFCDAISIVYAVAALAVGAGLSGLTLLPLKKARWTIRLVAGAVAGGAVLALVAILFPQCVAGPYAAVDPWLAENWLAQIGEAMPLLGVLQQQPVYAVAATAPAVLALIAALHAARWTAGTRRTSWLVFAAVLAVTIAVAFVQIRSIRITAALIAPACAYVVLLARGRYLERATVGRIAGLVASWLGFAGVAWWALAAFAVSAVPSLAVTESPVVPEDRAACLATGAYSELAAMPPQGIMTPLDLGAFVLLYTDHSVVAAPYHRNNQALLDAYAFFNGPIDYARDILAARGITMVLTCAALPEMKGLPQATADSFVRLYAEKRLPAWLQKLNSGAGPLEVYAVQPR